MIKKNVIRPENSSLEVIINEKNYFQHLISKKNRNQSKKKKKNIFIVKIKVCLFLIRSEYFLNTLSFFLFLF